MFTEVALGPGATVWLSRQEGPRRIPADGCVDLIVHGDSIRVCGPQTRWLQTTGSDSAGLLGLRLAAGTAHAVLPTDLVWLRDHVVDLSEAMGGGAAPLRDLMLRARDSSEPRAVLAHLAPLLPGAPWVTRVRACAAAGVPACEAATRTGYADQPHLNRELVRLTGRTPAQLSANAA